MQYCLPKINKIFKMRFNKYLFISNWSISFYLNLINIFWSNLNELFVHQNLISVFKQYFSIKLYQNLSNINRIKFKNLPLFQICWISFDTNLVNRIKLQLILNFSLLNLKRNLSVLIWSILYQLLKSTLKLIIAGAELATA